MKLIVFIFLLTFPSYSFAYLDPGSASMIIQGLIAGIASVATVVGLYWHKIKSFFSKKAEDDSKATNTDKE